MKIVYEKPQIEVVEFKLSDCIMLSGIGDDQDVSTCFSNENPGT